MDREDQPLALVSEAAVTATPVERRPWVSVGTVSRRLEPGLFLPVDLDGPGLVERMRDLPAAEYLVVDAQGRVFGVLTTTRRRPGVREHLSLDASGEPRCAD